MVVNAKHDLKRVTSHFQLEGRFLGAVPYGSGHINDTYASRFQQGDKVVRYIHQRINNSVFREPEK
ncbi:MAG: mucin desulfatase, partial [Armatimonadota bacterium]